MDGLVVKVPPWGYFLETTKRILVISKSNVYWFQTFFKGCGLKIVTVSRYLGWYISVPVS